VIAATPASIERAFANRGVRVSRVTRPPEICYPAGCTAVELWGGRTPIYFKPRSGRDFMVILFKQPSDAARLTRLEARSGLGTARHGSLVLLYYRLSARIARLRAAVAASG
jgi:hypothetical protein